MSEFQAQRVGTEDGESAREAIMNAAEQLFGERGLDGVSLREINAAAGYSVAVLHYHFATRDGLVRALLERAQPPLRADRESALAHLQSLEVVDPIDVASALVRPLAAGMDRAPNASAMRLRFLSRLYFDRSPYLSGAFEQSISQYLPYLQRALPQLEEAAIRQSWVFAVELAQYAILMYGLSPQRALEQYLDDLIGFIAGGLRDRASANRGG